MASTLNDNTTPLSRFIGSDSVRVVDASTDAKGNTSAVLQGRRFEKQILTCMPDGSPAAERLYPIMAPTTMQYPDFLAACTACGRCIEACPEHVLKAAVREYEVYDVHTAAGKATMSFELGYCRPTCQRCAAVCPTGAIPKLEAPRRAQLRMGWAQFNSRTCVTQTDGVACDACVRHCPHHAITMVSHGSQSVPRVNAHLCTGCGACEFYCPARPKAIYVEGV